MNIIHRFSSLAAALLLALSLSSGEVRADDTPATKPAFKGMELYSWRDTVSHEWRFSLLKGTNRQKSEKEIKDPKTALDSLEKLEAKLGQLPLKEQLIWNAHVDPQQFTLPPPEVVKRVEELAKEKQITLTGKLHP